MDASTQAGLSKVTVECTDPSDLFNNVKGILSTRLPLKNLHWKSPSRPVRSIESLNIDLIATKPATDEQSENTSTNAPAHRRHQIPGLRQTPYLKIYLLCCDDNETYKLTSRKLLREWIKANASTSGSPSSSSTGKADNHDAAEWLILHILPEGDVSEKAPSTSKWPGRGSTSVVEKVRADFNGSSKSAIDRVAQIRLPKPGNTQGSAELADQLDDLIEKMKNAIQTSFDLRVGQYEEDIRERDSQRTLPGWNFCTFFILKEGLAKGFEDVGLLEDALVGYDELSLGLEIVIREYLSGEGDSHGGGFLSFTEDWKEEAEKALATMANESSSEDFTDSENDNCVDENNDLGSNIIDLDQGHYPLDPAKKPYREMILANNISIFDFRTYIFARQLNLLLRSARAPSLQLHLMGVGQKSAQKVKAEDLAILAEICERGTEFIGLAARTLRYDLQISLKDSKTDADETARGVVIDNIVASWTYAATSQLLSQTATPLLVIPSSALRTMTRFDENDNTSEDVAEGKSSIPKRTSSLFMGTTVSTQSDPPPNASPMPRPGMGTRLASSAPPRPGSEDLASCRAELYIVLRRTIERVGHYRGWPLKWDKLDLLFDKVDISSDDMQDVSLNDDTESVSTQPFVPSVQYRYRPFGLQLSALVSALSSKKAFYHLYEMLTDEIFRHCVAGNRTRSAQAAMTDIGFLKFYQMDYDTAASYFHQIASFYGNNSWILLEGIVLELYARCLKELRRKEEYARILLKFLSLYAFYRESARTRKDKLTAPPISTILSKVVASHFDDLLQTIISLSKEYTCSLADFFGDITVNPEILHFPDQDGFRLQLSLRSLLDQEITIDSVKIRLVSAESSHNNELWMESVEKVSVNPVSTHLLIDSLTTLRGKYYVDRIELRAGNLAFTQAGDNSSGLPPGMRHEEEESKQDRRPFIWCYPPVEGFAAKVLAPHYINLEELRTIEVELDSGRNRIVKGVLRVRPATAGLRLRTAETTLVQGKLDIILNPESGNIDFENFETGSMARFRIPYTVDENHALLGAKIEIVYETGQGRFTFVCMHTIASALPVSVNVQDVFKEDVLFSRFTVSPAMMTPIRVLRCDMPSSDFFEVEPSIQGPLIMDVFPKQPASFLYRIHRRKKPYTAKKPLQLTVHFIALDEECLEVVTREFSAAIEKSPFAPLARLLTPHIVEAFRSKLSTAGMEMIGLIREVEVFPFANLHWETIINAIAEPRRSGIRTWLSEWHESNPILVLPDPDLTRLSRAIVIPVDVPEIQVVHTAELQLQNFPSDNGEKTHASVGQAIAAELHFRHTQAWSRACRSDKKGENDQRDQNSYEFSYDIHANQDVWLIGGYRRGNFTAREGETRKFPVILIPQRAGYLLLPSIDIKTYVAPSLQPSSHSPPLAHPAAVHSAPSSNMDRPSSSSSSSSSSTSSTSSASHDSSTADPSATTTTTTMTTETKPPSYPSSSPHSLPQRQQHPAPTRTGAKASTTSHPPPNQRRLIPSEVDYKNQAETLLVLPDLQQTTISLESGNTAGGVWLIDSERVSSG